MIRLEPQGLVVPFDGFFDLALVSEGIAEIVVGLGVIGLQFQSFVVVAHRLRHLVLQLEGSSEVVVGLGVVGLQAKGLAVVSHRVGDVVLQLEGGSEVVVGFGVVRLIANGLAKAGHGLLQTSEGLECAAQVAMRGGKVRLRLDGGAHVLDRQVMTANLIVGNAEEMEGICVARIHFQDLLVQMYRIAEIVGLMMLDGEIESLRYRKHILTSLRLVPEFPRSRIRRFR